MSRVCYDWERDRGKSVCFTFLEIWYHKDDDNDGKYEAIWSYVSSLKETEEKYDVKSEKKTLKGFFRKTIFNQIDTVELFVTLARKCGEMMENLSVSPTARKRLATEAF